MSLRIAAALAVTSAAVVAGCGSSSSGGNPPPRMSAAAYKQTLHQVSQAETTAQNRLAGVFHAKTVLKLRAGLTRFETDQASVAAQLGTLRPPANATAANAALAQAFADNANAIHTLLPKLDHAKSVKQALAIIQHDKAGQRTGQEIDTAIKRLQQLRYTSGS